MSRARARHVSLALLVIALLVSAASAEAPPAVPPAATLELWNRPIIVLRTMVGGRTPVERAAAAEDRLGGAPRELLAGEVTVGAFTSQHGNGVEIEVHGFPAFRIYQDDLDPES